MQIAAISNKDALLGTFRSKSFKFTTSCVRRERQCERPASVFDRCGPNTLGWAELAIKKARTISRPLEPYYPSNRLTIHIEFALVS